MSRITPCLWFDYQAEEALATRLLDETFEVELTLGERPSDLQ